MTQPTGTPEIPEFRDVEQLPDGSWRAVHVSTGEPITAPTFEHLETVDAPMVRIARALRVGAPVSEIPFRTGDPS